MKRPDAFGAFFVSSAMTIAPMFVVIVAVTWALAVPGLLTDTFLLSLLHAAAPNTTAASVTTMRSLRTAADLRGCSGRTHVTRFRPVTLGYSQRGEHRGQRVPRVGRRRRTTAG